MPGENENEERPAWAVAFDKRLAQLNGDATRLAEQLYRDNFTQREELRTLRETLPPQGAVILSGDDATRWQSYQALGAPDALQTALGERQTLADEAAKLKREKALRRAAEHHKWDADVLAELPGLGDVEWTEAQGETPATPVVTVEGQRVPLDTHIQQRYPKFLPALAVDAQPTNQQRTAYPSQTNGKPPTPVAPVDGYINKTYGPRKQGA